MTSAQQVRANRANAKLSTGPADTSRTKLNSTRHGLAARETVIPGESQAEYDAFHASLTRQLAPGSETEKLLADRIAVAAWRLRRFTRIEAAFFNNRIEAYLETRPDHDADAALANLFSDPAEAQKMRLFLRYQTAVQREYDTAMRLLDKARKERAHQEFMRAAETPIVQAAVVVHLEAPEVAQSEPDSRQIGFASQTLEPHPPNRLAEAA